MNYMRGRATHCARLAGVGEMTGAAIDWTNFLNGHSKDDALVQLAIHDVQKSGLTPETLAKAGVRLFNGDKEALKKCLGFASIDKQDILRLSRLIEFPYFNP